jgi:uncharacterized low-complexity protein
LRKLNTVPSTFDKSILETEVHALGRIGLAKCGLAKCGLAKCGLAKCGLAKCGLAKCGLRLYIAGSGFILRAWAFVGLDAYLVKSGSGFY